MTPTPAPVGVLIGRWQVDRLHEGHVALLNIVRTTHPKVVLLVGVRPGPTDTNDPLDFRLRERMLRALVPDATILPLLDMPGDDDRWARQVDTLVTLVAPTERAVIYGGRDSFIPHYNGAYSTRAIDTGLETLSGTAIREAIAAQPRDSEDFRAGVIFAKQLDYPRVSPAVDVALVRGGSVLLIRKPTELHWRFPGGFVSKKDASYEAAAKRELYEETGLTAEGALHYIGSYNVDDPRVRGRKDAIFTTFYSAAFTFGKPVAGDDAGEAAFFDIAKIADNPFDVMPEHRPLLNALLAALGATASL